VLGLEAYNLAFFDGLKPTLGLSSALGWLLFVVAIIMAGINVRVLRSRGVTTASTLPGTRNAAAERAVRAPRARGASGLTARVIVYLLLTIYALISLYPFLLMISGALKDDKEILLDGHLVPHNPTLSTLSHT